MEGVFLEVEGEDVMEKAIGGEKASDGFFCRGSGKAGLRTPRDRTEQGGGRDEVEGWESRVMICIWGRGVS